jgi:hypothetical protein
MGGVEFIQNDDSHASHSSHSSHPPTDLPACRVDPSNFKLTEKKR